MKEMENEILGLLILLVLVGLNFFILLFPFYRDYKSKKNIDWHPKASTDIFYNQSVISNF